MDWSRNEAGQPVSPDEPNDLQEAHPHRQRLAQSLIEEKNYLDSSFFLSLFVQKLNSNILLSELKDKKGKTKPKIDKKH
jgi:hypothetical protein